MKTLKNLSALLLILLSANVFAAGNSKKEKYNVNYTIHRYIDALSYGKIRGIGDLLDDHAKFTITGGNKALNFNKTQVLTSLQNNHNIRQNCVTDYNIVDLNESHAVVKVTMKYERFSRVNFLSMANTASGWKIMKVTSSFI